MNDQVKLMARTVVKDGQAMQTVRRLNAAIVTRRVSDGMTEVLCLRFRLINRLQQDNVFSLRKKSYETEL